MTAPWDVVVAGASFAGLATAAEVDGKTLLLDRFDLGTHQTSACGTFVPVLEAFGCEDSILRTFDVLVLHMPRPIRIPLVHPLCTFDYARLCKGLFARSRATFLRATVRGLEGDEVVTDVGRFPGRCFVDATGWHGALTDGSNGRNRRLAFGLEVDTDWVDDDIHFLVDPRLVPWGAGWIFPTDDGARVGVASYGPAKGLRASLAALLRRLHVEGRNLHGGAIPWDLRGGAHGKVFLVGDAAGLALPLTLEGIRRSLEAGRRCGRLVDAIVHGRMDLEEGLRRHDAAVRQGERAYRLLTFIQRSVGKGLDPLIGQMSRPRALQKLYLGV
jgi:flavin-dependent dehydrogenase